VLLPASVTTGVQLAGVAGVVAGAVWLVVRHRRHRGLPTASIGDRRARRFIRTTVPVALMLASAALVAGLERAGHHVMLVTEHDGVVEVEHLTRIAVDDDDPWDSATSIVNHAARPIWLRGILYDARGGPVDAVEIVPNAKQSTPLSPDYVGPDDPPPAVLVVEPGTHGAYRRWLTWER
jgi:hypothetical protein